jgi:phage-related protein
VQCDEGTYRLIYIARLGEVLYALHAFQKKAQYGITTSQHELNLIAQRLGLARAITREG